MVNLPAGKLPPELLRSLLARAAPDDPSVVVGSAIGEDAAVLDTGGDELLVVKTDPITFVTGDIGHYLLAVNGNDLATMGAEPRWLLVTALLPEGIAPESVRRIFSSLTEACAKASVSLVGGHTEVTIGIDRPILVGCLLGTVERQHLVRTAGARAGDALLLVGGVAIEGTAILAGEHAERLVELGVDREVIRRASDWIQSPGISVLPAARALRSVARVHSMHDPTEGGVITAVHELAEAAELGVRLDRSAIPVLPECSIICDAAGLDPLGLLASGALLAALDPGEAPAAIETLASLEIQAVQIGEMVPAGEGRLWNDAGRADELPVFRRDELARFLESA